ncbi:DUF4956 domain-containing protein [Bryobacterales bacterium F-183]|nr:DUF4956 domain-containing protein [Bryobacterales bacterium F-183]
MPEFLTSAFGEALVAGSPVAVFLRILAAVLLGAIVAWVHRRSTAPNAAMAATLVLLAGLIAMVTQVIGDNVARAFSLVGALSIVRFRTVVRDTRDTAFVIFSVAVGMAVGAQAPWAALMGVLVVGGTALVLSRTSAANPNHGEPFILALRSAPTWDPEAAAGPLIDQYATDRKLHSVRTTKQGLSLDHCYTICIKDSAKVHDLIQQLNRLEGVQELKLLRQGSDEESSRI